MFKKILIPVDVSRERNAERLCQSGLELAKGNEAEIRLVAIMPDYGMPLVASFFPADAQAKLKQEMQATLEQLAANKVAPEAPVTTMLRQGKRAQEILAEASDWGADTIVIGCRKKAASGGQRVLGSCSSSVAERAGCSVLIVR